MRPYDSWKRSPTAKESFRISYAFNYIICSLHRIADSRPFN